MAWRRLKHNKSTQIARTLLFVDCETRSETKSEDNTGFNRLSFGVVRSGRFINERGVTNWTRKDSTRFNTQDEFWAYVKSKARKKETTWIYAHNAGFDFIILGLLKRLEKGDFTICKPRKSRNKETGKTSFYGLLMLEDPPTVIGLEDSDGCRYVLCDTLNYWRISLEMLGESIGLPKLVMPSVTTEKLLWYRYCNRDVEIIEKAVIELIEWWREHDLGNWRWTAPGLAWSAFRHRFMSHDIIFHDEQPVRALERDGYFGGQLEAYRIGEINERVYQYDVVSLYPSVMKNKLYPIKLEQWNVSRKLSPIPHSFDALSTIAEVEIDSPVETFPTRIDDIVTYARGNGLVTLAGPELQYAIDRGYVKRIGAYATYAMAPIFTEYVAFFYELKEYYTKQGNRIKSNFVKLLLNSLYGKFAQRGGRWQYNPGLMPLYDFGLFWEGNPFSSERKKCLSLWDVAFEWQVKGEVDNAAPSISAFVTSYARQKMRAIKSVCGVGNYFYMSTDSILINETANSRLEREGNVIGTGLGQLKLEKTADSAWIGGLHWYRVGDKLVEGSKKQSDATETINRESWTELQFDSLLSVIQRTTSDPEHSDCIDIRKIEKHRHNGYSKGHVMADGFIVPYCISELPI